MENPKDVNEITQANIKAICEHEKSKHESEPLKNKMAHAIAFWSGTVSFIIWHAILFGGWIIANIFFIETDPFPFIMLTTIVSLESIFLSGFVLISQNALANEADKRHKLDLQINLLAERESTAMLRLLEKMAVRLNIPEDDLDEVKKLSTDTDPADLLEQIIDIENKEK